MTEQTLVNSDIKLFEFFVLSLPLEKSHMHLRINQTNFKSHVTEEGKIIFR